MVGTDIVSWRVNGALLERQVSAPGADEQMVNYTAAGARLFYHADGHGSVVAVSDGAGSAAGRTIAYDEYGRPSQLAARTLHAGKLYLTAANAYYNEARFYDPRLGRFLQPDPIGYGGGVNLYAYAGNDPVNAGDPTGTVTASSCASDGRGNVSASCAGGIALDAMVTYREVHGPRAYGGGGADPPGMGHNGGPPVVDVVARAPGTGRLVAFEVKANTAQRSAMQQRKDYLLQEYGGRIRSRHQPNFRYNDSIRMPTRIVRVYCKRPQCI